MCDLASDLIEKAESERGGLEELHAYLPHDQFAYRLAFAITDAKTLCTS
jgi:hypothetical protein